MLKLSGTVGSPRISADIVYSYGQHRTTVKMPDGTAGVTQSPFFSATWLGAYDWVRYGQEGTTPAVEPSARPTAEPTLEIPVIAAAYTGVLEFHFKNENGYTVISDERMHFTTHIMGIMKSSFSIDTTYSNFTFPSATPAP